MALIFSGQIFTSTSFSQNLKAGPPAFDAVDYGYEVNFAPVALLANWYNLDFLKYYKTNDPKKSYDKIGYGISLLSYLRNGNNFDDTFPSWKGFGVGGNIIFDSKDFYYGVHVIGESYERYRDTGSLIQKRDGFRANIVYAGKEFIRKNFAAKFGWGIEVSSYRIQEFNELNKQTINQYYSTILNPIFFEFKLAYLF